MQLSWIAFNFIQLFQFVRNIDTPTSVIDPTSHFRLASAYSSSTCFIHSTLRLTAERFTTSSTGTDSTSTLLTRYEQRACLLRDIVNVETGKVRSKFFYLTLIVQLDIMSSIFLRTSATSFVLTTSVHDAISKCLLKSRHFCN